MKVTLLVIGKTGAKYINDGIDQYERRLRHYINFDIKIIPDIKKAKNTTEQLQKMKEGEHILAKIPVGAEMHLFDEKGKMVTSRDFALFFQKKMIQGLKDLVLVIGGPYGFSEQVYEKANSRISLSKMTFPHELARLLCVEQIYRAFTILNAEPYHHD